MTETPVLKESENRAIIEHLDGLKRIEELGDLDPAQLPQLYAVPSGYELKSTKQMLDQMRVVLPLRAKGTSEHLSLESLVAHVVRFKDDGSVIFVDTRDKDHPAVIVVLDYTKPGLARNGDWRATYRYPIGEEWSRWGSCFVNAGASGGLSQQQFAELLEERMVDLLHPDSAGAVLKADMGKVGLSLGTPQDMLALSKGLAVSTESKLVHAIKLSDGGVKLQWEETSTTGDPVTGAPVIVPGGFVLAIPVFEGGEVFQLGVRLRLRTAGGKTLWQLIPRGRSKVFEVAVRDTATKIQAATNCPLFYGYPET